MNQANPIPSNLWILSAFIDVLAAPSWYFLYSARWVDTHRPSAVLSLYLVGTWQLPYLTLYANSSFCKKEEGKKWTCNHVSYMLHTQKSTVFIQKRLYTIEAISCKMKLTNFSSQLACPLRLAHRKPMLCSRSSRESLSDEFLPSIRFFCSIRCY